MPKGRLTRIAERLEAAGIDPGDLRTLQGELDVVEEPPGFFSRITESAKRTAVRQWRHLVGELEESREVMALLSRRVRSGEPLTDEETDKIRSQLFDVVRAVPAGMIMVGNAVQPIPGTTLFTPWLLMRLGLMPSRWREAHLLDQLQKEEARLRAEGFTAAADELEELEHRIEKEADAREEAARQAALLTRWDFDKNGEWDDDELDAYERAIEETRTKAIRYGAHKRWFLLGGGQVVGPVRLSQFVNLPAAEPLLVCIDGDSAWVEPEAVLHERTEEMAPVVLDEDDEPAW